MTNDNVFDKKGLKTGMIITTRNGLEYVVFIDTVFQFDNKDKDIIVNVEKKIWNKLSNYTDDLRYITGDRSLDIVKIEIPYYPYCFMDIYIYKKDRVVLWEREETIEMTMEDLKKHFGCKVVIIEDMKKEPDSD